VLIVAVQIRNYVISFKKIVNNIGKQHIFQNYQSAFSLFHYIFV